MSGHMLDTIALPDLEWADEFDWSPVVITTEHSVGGALIVDTATRVGGRTITLQGGEDYAWATRVTVLALQSLAAIAGRHMTLTLADGRVFRVMFAGERPIEARPIFGRREHFSDDVYSVTVRLLEVPA